MIHPSIIDVDDSTPVITIVPPPELHLLLGPVNHLFKGMEKVWSNSDDWLKSCFIKKSDYHGGCLEGNDYKKLLNNVHKLQELRHQKHQHFVTAFSSFNYLVLSCYGYDLQPDYKSKIAK